MQIHLYDNVTRAYVKSFATQGQAEKELGMYRGAVTDYMKAGVRAKRLFSYEKQDYYPIGKTMAPETSVAPEIPAMLLSEEQIREKHDMFFRILHFVKSIPEGQFTDESSMLRQLELIGKPRYREALSRTELKDYRGKVDGVVYYGNSNSIKKLKGEGILL